MKYLKISIILIFFYNVCFINYTFSQNLFYAKNIFFNYDNTSLQYLSAYSYEAKLNFLEFFDYSDIISKKNNKAFFFKIVHQITKHNFNSNFINNQINKTSTKLIYSGKKDNTSFKYAVSSDTNFKYYSFFNLEKLNQISLLNFYSDTTEIVMLRKESFDYSINHYKFYNDWIFFILLLNLIIYTWNNHIITNFIRTLILSVFRFKMFIKLYREKNILINRTTLFLQVLFYINFALFVFLINSRQHFFNFTTNKYFEFAIYFIASYLLITLYNSLISLLGIVFKETQNINLYLYYIRIHLFAIGFFLFPCNILINYSNINIFEFYFYLGIAIILIFNLIRIYRLIIIFFEKHYPIFYLILYFCGFEIVPIFLAIKFYKYLI